MNKTLTQNEIKKLVACNFASTLKPNQTIGLGSGTTVESALEEIVKNKDLKNSLEFVPSSNQILKFAQNLGLKIAQENSKLDTVFDGADWVDSHFNIVKGYGGALFREKILASSGADYHILIDESKLCTSFENKKIPLEISPFRHLQTIELIQNHTYFLPILSGLTLRKNNSNSLASTALKQDTCYLTDNGNYLIDVEFGSIVDIKKIDEFLKKISGVVETGLFFVKLSKIWIGYVDGTVKII